MGILHTKLDEISSSIFFFFYKERFQSSRENAFSLLPEQI